MSTVTITELEYGATASAATINTTNTSWNSATAAGQIGARNFREEGIDRRVIAQNAVYSTNRGTNSFLSTGSLTTSGAGGVTATFDFGATDYIGPIVDSGSSNLKIIVGYSVWGTGTAGQTLTTSLETATDPAGPWASLADTVRSKSTRSTARANGSMAAKIVIEGSASQNLYYRLRVVGSGALADFSYGTLYAYTLLQ